jgi:chromosome segregation ATPase
VNNTREINLSLGRDRIARALSKIERLSRDAIETIAQLRTDKQELESRMSELTKRYEQERSNLEQRAALLNSVNSESEEREKSFKELSEAKARQEHTIQGQLATIAQLKADLSDRAVIMNEQLENERNLRAEAEEMRAKAASLEERLTATSYERDTMKSQLYQKEREDAQWAIRLSSEERNKATKAIDVLIDQLSELEQRIGVNGMSVNGER